MRCLYVILGLGYKAGTISSLSTTVLVQSFCVEVSLSG